MAERVSITSEEELRAWLEGKPREWAIVIAARAALRVLPNWRLFLNPRVFKEQEKSEGYVLALFRSSAVSLSSALVPDRDLRAAAGAVAYAAAGAVAYAAAGDVAYAAATRAAAAAAAYAADAAADAAAGAVAYAAARAAADAADAAGAAAYAAARAAADAADAAGAAAYAAADSPADSAAWQRVSSDAAFLANGGSVTELAHKPLGAIEVDDFFAADDVFEKEDFFAPTDIFSNRWRDLKTKLLALDPNWQLWVEWWGAVRDGHAPWGLPRDVANQIMVQALTWPQAKWDRPAAVVNADIQALIDAARERVAGNHKPTEKLEGKAADSNSSGGPHPTDTEPKKPRKGTVKTNAAPRPVTKVGKSILANAAPIALQAHLILSVIESEIGRLNDIRPNSDEAREKLQAEIAALENVRIRITDMRDAVIAFPQGESSEQEVVGKADAFFKPFREAWTENGKEYADGFVRCGLFGSALGLAVLCGGPALASTVVVGAIVAKKPLIEVLKAAKGVFKIT